MVMNYNCRNLRESKYFLSTEHKPKEMARLFCFPYGGGNASIYREWNRLLPPQIGVYPIQLPGRGARISENLPTNLSSIIDELVEAILPLSDLPYFFFGHSMGALLSFELCRRLRTHETTPVHLFVSGYRAPHLEDSEPHLHTLPDHEFLQEIINMNGTPTETISDKSFVEFFLPILRSDFRICELYRYIEEVPLDIPITAFGGNKDPDVSPDDLKEWKIHTTNRFNYFMLDGDHFFLHQQQSRLVNMISLIGIEEMKRFTMKR